MSKITVHEKRLERSSTQSFVHHEIKCNSYEKKEDKYELFSIWVVF